MSPVPDLACLVSSLGGYLTGDLSFVLLPCLRWRALVSCWVSLLGTLQVLGPNLGLETENYVCLHSFLSRIVYPYKLPNGDEVSASIIFSSRLSLTWLPR